MRLPVPARWLVRTLAFVLLVPALVGLVVYAAVALSGTLESGFLLAVHAVPPLVLMAIVYLGLVAWEAGTSAKGKGEVAALLRKKQSQVLPAPLPKLADPLANAIAAGTPKPKTAKRATVDWQHAITKREPRPVLDVLVSWKRRHHPSEPQK